MSIIDRYSGPKKDRPLGGLLLSIGVLLISLCIALYSPGLHGPFLLDDLSSLVVLAETGGVHDLRSLFRYLAADISSPIGRPVANLSFLLNYLDWPASPWPFKATNLGLHVTVGTLLFLLVNRLVSPTTPTRQAYWVALLAAAFWLLNPLNVSTTLYVVQRMAQLSALFVLTGQLAYVHGRRRQAAGQRGGYVWMTAGITLLGVLAVLSKENGALLPLLALAVEYTVLRHHLGLAAPDRRWTLLFLWLPSTMLLAAMVYASGPGAYAPRAFTMAERLMTEARVLFDYAWHWFNPLLSPRGVLAEGYPLSRSLLDPWSTLPAVLGLLAALAWSILYRQRYPLAALAILFFLAGHAMESTVVPLEIYFEHRNYLPAVFLALPLAHWVVANAHRWRAVPLIAGLILAVLAVQSARVSMAWSDQLSLAMWSAEVNPDSARAQDYLATTLSERGRPDLAVAVLEQAIKRQPTNSHHHLHLLVEKCRIQAIGPEEWQRLQGQFQKYPLGIKSLPLLSDLADSTPSPGCKGVDAKHLLEIQDILVNHPVTRATPETLRQFLHVQGVLRLRMGQPGGALQSFAQAAAIQADIGMGLLQVARLGSSGYYREGLQWLAVVEKMPRPHGWRDRMRAWDFEKEIEHLRKQLQRDLNTRSAADS